MILSKVLQFSSYSRVYSLRVQKQIIFANYFCCDGGMGLLAVVFSNGLLQTCKKAIDSCVFMSFCSLFLLVPKCFQVAFWGPIIPFPVVKDSSVTDRSDPDRSPSEPSET